MKLLRCSVKNFGSYKDLEFDFSNLGLSLVYGATGSGKSTLPDIPAWTLFGVTSKGYKADEVKNWLNPDEITMVTLQVQTPKGNILVTRTRGKSNQNDLYWKEEGNEDVSIRGKDLLDTQRLLNARLGVDADLYISGSYYHEFCSTGSFFLASTSAKRELFEKIVDLSLPLKLLEKAKEIEKISKQEYDALLLNERDLKLTLDHNEKELENTKSNNENWLVNKSKKIEELWHKVNDFEIKRSNLIRKISYDMSQISLGDMDRIMTAINELTEEVSVLYKEKCSECGGSKHSDEIYNKERGIGVLNKELNRENNLRKDIDRLQERLDDALQQPNPYSAAYEEAENAVNIYYKDRLDQLHSWISELKVNLDAVQKEIKTKYDYMTALWKISCLSFELRGLLLHRAVQQIEELTNQYLEKYFDSEIKVSFSLEDADKLTVSLQKNGHECVYKQLSKGQRALLRLSFVVAVMHSVSNNQGVHFDNIFMDEALDGLDNDLKSKAFRLFEELSKEHASIIVIDHSEEFKTLFNRQFSVTMDSDTSTIKEIYE